MKWDKCPVGIYQGFCGFLWMGKLDEYWMNTLKLSWMRYDVCVRSSDELWWRSLGSFCLGFLIWPNQPIHAFIVGCLNPCLQGTNVGVVSLQSRFLWFNPWMSLVTMSPSAGGSGFQWMYGKVEGMVDVLIWSSTRWMITWRSCVLLDCYFKFKILTILLILEKVKGPIFPRNCKTIYIYPI